jgi:ubiquinone/menaquinone biosynthesis C-methylase UbiE
MSEQAMSPYVRLIGRVGITRHPFGLKQSDILLHKIGIQKNYRVLDAGCGAGHSAAHIAEKYACTIVGIDFSGAAIDQARALYSEEPYFPRMSFLEAEMTHLPFSDNYFDVVLCESVLLFVNDKERALKELTRVLKPRGYLLLNELCIAENKHSEKIKDYFARLEMDAHLLSAASLSRFFEKNLWEIVVHDEQVFTFKEQLKSDLAQFGNKKGLLQLLELAHLALTDKKMRDDLVSMTKYMLKMPPQVFKNLRTLAMLARKIQI